MFSDGMDDFVMDSEGDPRSGRPTECRNDNADNISQLFLQNRHLSPRMLADELNMGKDTVRKVVFEDLRNGRFVRSLFHTL
jgi:hypothetical protein